MLLVETVKNPNFDGLEDEWQQNAFLAALKLLARQTWDLLVECVHEPADDLSNSSRVKFIVRGMRLHTDFTGEFHDVQLDPEGRGHRVVEVTAKPHFRNLIDVNRAPCESSCNVMSHCDRELYCR